MPYIRTPSGITPPSPGLEREEPTFVNEDDIPRGDGGRTGTRHPREEKRDDRPARSSERE
ncbi:MAG TPA: hypothetical protein VHL79_05015 [Ramlibacter sp.]|jgi:hypothetical protein|nr:hypothetical protein [Ramlibacter sp.]